MERISNYDTYCFRLRDTQFQALKHTVSGSETHSLKALKHTVSRLETLITMRWFESDKSLCRAFFHISERTY